MTFEEDLLKRRIDVTAFASGDPERFAAWQQMYRQMHPNSFYARVKMVLNDIRRRFWLAEAVKAAIVTTPETLAKPIVARRAAIPGTGKPAFEPETSTVTETPAPAVSPAKGRAVFRKPATPVKQEEENIAQPTAENELIGKQEPEAPGTLAPARPRPVFRKPSAPAQTNISENKTEIAGQEGTNAILPVHTNPEPEAEKPKPRPRPVFKKPEIAESVTTLDAIIPVKPEDNISPDENNILSKVDREPTTKPPRPRPIFKRPSASVESESLEVENKPVAEIKEPDKPELEERQEPEVSNLPRPRPIFKRPAKPADGEK